MDRRVISQSKVDEAKALELNHGIILYDEEKKEKVSEKKPDDTVSKILKYIPAEISAAYVAAEASIKSVSSPELEWIIFGILLLFTPLYIWRVGTLKISERDNNNRALMDATTGKEKEKKDVPWLQMIVCSGAFVLWVFALGGPFATTGTWYHSEYGAVALILYTVLLPIVLK
jgi:hypothetical protein